MTQLTAKIKLVYDTETGLSLFRTMALSNAACTWLSEQVFGSRIFGKFRMQKSYYLTLREMFPELSAQAVIHVVRKVADSYKKDKKTLRTYEPLGAVTYDLRILSWKKDSVSIWTVDGRKKIPFVCGEPQKKQLEQSILLKNATRSSKNKPENAEQGE
jgi:putative transposase